MTAVAERMAPLGSPKAIELDGTSPRWPTRQLRHVAELIVSNVDKLAAEGELPVRLCNYVDVYKNERITDRLPFMNATATPDEIKRFRLRRGDVVITKDSESWQDIAVPALVDYEAQDFVCGYHLAVLRPDPAMLDGAFLLRALQSQPVAAQFHAIATGITRYGVAQPDIKSVRIPLPPLDEQRLIARFLDHHGRKVNAFIHAKRHLIDLLTEQKQAIIQQAVTRGLDRSVPLKPSGIDWLGDIPCHWTVRRAGGVFRPVRLPSEPHLPILEVSIRHGVRVRTFAPDQRKQRMDDLSKYQTARTGDISFNIMRAWQGAIGVVPTDGLVSPAYAVGTLTGSGEAAYFVKLLRTSTYKGAIENRSRGIVPDRNRLYWDQFKQIPLLSPSPEEQRTILEWIREREQSIDDAIHRALREIELILEYRQRVVSDTVTGNLDVVDAAKDLPAIDSFDYIPDNGNLEESTLDSDIDDEMVPEDEPA